MLNHPILRWTGPLLVSGVFLVLMAHQSPVGQVFSRYSKHFFILLVATGVLAVALWWIALSQHRARTFLLQCGQPSTLAIGISLLGGLALLDLFIDTVPLVAWLPVVVAAIALSMSREKTGSSRLQGFASSAALLIGTTVSTLVLAELLFRTVLLENYVPETDEEFQHMIAADWPRPVPAERRPGIIRILGLSDSFGQAGGQRNYHYVLEELFAGAGIEVEVVNFSRPGYEPLEQLALLRRFARQYQPDLVVHAFFVGNDFETPDALLRVYQGIVLRPAAGLWNWRPYNFLLRRWLQQYVMVLRNSFQKTAEAAASPGPNAVKTPTATPDLAPRDRAPAMTPAATPVTTAGKASATSETATSSPVPPESPVDVKDKTYGADGTLSQAEFMRVEKYRSKFYAPGPPPAVRWRETGKLLDAIRDEVRGLGSNYLMVIHPDQMQVEEEVVSDLERHYSVDLSGYDFTLPQQFLLDRCSALDLQCVDLLPEFKRREEKLYLVRDTHYNRAGNRLAAEAIFEKIIEQELLPGTRDTTP